MELKSAEVRQNLIDAGCSKDTITRFFESRSQQERLRILDKQRKHLCLTLLEHRIRLPPEKWRIKPYFLMPFVVSLYHGIKRQVNGKNYCRNHKKKGQSYSIKSVAVLLLFRDCNQARQTDAIIFSLSLTSERLH